MAIFYKSLMLIIMTGCSVHFCYSQHFLSAGAGAMASSLASDKMDTFRETYNETNLLVIKNKLDGFSFGIGLRYQLAYRYHDKWCAAFLVGYQALNDFDVADFTDGSQRKLALKLKSYFLELEMGYNWGTFFTNSLLCFYLDRNIQIKNSYKSFDPDFVSSFTGTFKAPSSYSIDMGIAAGLFKNPFFIVLKVTHPIYTAGKKDILRDSNREVPLQKFPADYAAYSQNEDYPGVGSNLDGLKAILTLSYALELNF